MPGDEGGIARLSSHAALEQADGEPPFATCERKGGPSVGVFHSIHDFPRLIDQATTVVEI